jgi:hypothetical protein
LDQALGGGDHVLPTMLRIEQANSAYEYSLGSRFEGARIGNKPARTFPCR